MPKIAVILSGCGRFDGSETKEAVLTLLAIDKLNASYQCFAPNDFQHHVINHLTGEVQDGAQRHMLTEAARIPHEPVLDLVDFQSSEFDALVLPGGFGAAKNLCDFAQQEAITYIHPEVSRAIISMRDAHKPVGFICIAPVLIPALYPKGVEMTLGHDPHMAHLVTQQGAKHRACPATACIADATHRVVSTPAYMIAQKVNEAAAGIEALIKQLIEWS